MPLDFVGFRKEFRKSRHADDQPARRAQQPSELLHGVTVIVQMLDDIEGQHAVIGRHAVRQFLRQICFN